MAEEYVTKVTFLFITNFATLLLYTHAIFFSFHLPSIWSLDGNYKLRMARRLSVSCSIDKPKFCYYLALFVSAFLRVF